MKQALKIHTPVTIILAIMVLIIFLTSCSQSKMVIINYNGLQPIRFAVIPYDKELKSLIKKSPGIDVCSFRYYKHHPNIFRRPIRASMMEN